MQSSGSFLPSRLKIITRPAITYSAFKQAEDISFASLVASFDAQSFALTDDVPEYQPLNPRLKIINDCHCCTRLELVHAEKSLRGVE